MEIPYRQAKAKLLQANESQACVSGRRNQLPSVSGQQYRDELQLIPAENGFAGTIVQTIPFASTLVARLKDLASVVIGILDKMRGPLLGRRDITRVEVERQHVHVSCRGGRRRSENCSKIASAPTTCACQVANNMITSKS